PGTKKKGARVRVLWARRWGPSPARGLFRPESGGREGQATGLPPKLPQATVARRATLAAMNRGPQVAETEDGDARDSPPCDCAVRGRDRLVGGGARAGAGRRHGKTDHAGGGGRGRRRRRHHRTVLCRKAHGTAQAAGGGGESARL